MSSKARELAKFSYDIHVNESLGNLGIGTTSNITDRLYVEGGVQVSGVTTYRNDVHILYNKKLGVGIATPVYGRIHLNAPSGDAVMHISHEESGRGSWISFAEGRDGSNYKWSMGYHDFGNVFAFAPLTSNLSGPVLALKQDNKVGIATTAPETPLHVFGGTSNDQVVTIESTSSSGIGAPDLSLFTNDPALQNGETIGVLRFDSFDSAGSRTEYARVATTVVSTDPTTKNATVIVQARRNSTTVSNIAEFQGSSGDVKIASANGAGIVLAAPNGTLYKITVTNAGAINVAPA